MSKITRRQFNKLLGTGIAAIPASVLIAQLPSQAEDLPLVDPESATAKQLQYAAVTPDEGKRCDGCLLYAAADDEKGKCSIFPANLVPAEAWCSAYAPKPA